MPVDPAPMSAKRAVLLGHLVVDVPVFAAVGATMLLLTQVTHVGWQIALFTGIAPAWLCWSLAVPRWRKWALAQGADPSEVQRLAHRTGLVWSEGSLMSRTELPPKR